MKDLIYVVEDDEGMQEVYEGAFEENYQTRIFSSGADFFEAFNAQKPDLIILDIMLPEMDGFRLISEIRREGFADIPVMLMTADTSEESKQKCIEAGAEDFIAKPIVPAVLKSRVARIMELSELKKSSSEG